MTPPPTDVDRSPGLGPAAVVLGRVLRIGTALAVVVIIIGAAGDPLGLPTAGRLAERVGMMIMVATPIVGLLTLGAAFARAGDRRYLLLTVLVLLLITATAVIGTG